MWLSHEPGICEKAMERGTPICDLTPPCALGEEERTQKCHLSFLLLSRAFTHKIINSWI